jgi:hypothetical protein
VGDVMVGFVYVIHAQGCGLFKIGWAKDPAKRIRDLQTASPDALELVGSRPGTLRDEADLHRRFRPLRIRGEWFALAPEDVQAILGVAYARTPANPRTQRTLDWVLGQRDPRAIDRAMMAGELDDLLGCAPVAM